MGWQARSVVQDCPWLVRVVLAAARHPGRLRLGHVLGAAPLQDPRGASVKPSSSDTTVLHACDLPHYLISRQADGLAFQGPHFCFPVHFVLRVMRSRVFLLCLSIFALRSHAPRQNDRLYSYVLHVICYLCVLFEIL